MTRELAQRIRRVGFTIMTGGGPGLMEAANRGAQDNRCDPHRMQHRAAPRTGGEPYLDLSLTFERASLRKVLLLKYSMTFVGGAQWCRAPWMSSLKR
ncbi:MAG: hypothetical protein IPI07_18860 [Flavobacteriales bacterium]|nr:hypothetical protein [Flavobacteriales bacterium]